MSLRGIRFSRRRRSKSGQLIVPMALFWIFLVLLCAYLLQNSELLAEKMRLQNAADTSAYSMALVQARALNSISVLNQGIELLQTIVIIIYAVYAVLITASILSGGTMLKALWTYHRYAKRVVKFLRNTAKQMAWLQDQIVKYAPLACIVEGERIALENGAQLMLPYPIWPLAGAPKKLSLKLHVNRAKNSYLSSKAKRACRPKTNHPRDKAHQLRRALIGKEMLFQEHWSYSGLKGEFSTRNHPLRNSSFVALPPGIKFVSATLGGCPTGGSATASALDFPNPMVLSKNFFQRQKILSINKSKPVSGLFDGFEQHSVYSAAQATVGGKDLQQDNWRAKLEKITLHREIFKLGGFSQLQKLATKAFPKVSKVTELDQWLLH